MIHTQANIVLGRKGRVLVLLAAVSIVLLALAAPARAASTFTVSRTDDPAPGACFSASDCSLREAVIAANATPGPDTIVLQPTTYDLTIAGSAGAQQGDLDTTENLDIKSAGPGDATIDAHEVDRVLEVVSGGLSLSDITVRNGLATADAQGFVRGGGVLVSGSLYLYDSRVVENDTPPVNGAEGGGIYNGGHTVMSRSEINNNTAPQGFGGGIYTPANATTEIRDSKLSGNDAVFGGALASASGGGNVLVDRSQLTLNSAGLGGASYQLGTSTYNFTNTTLNNNTAVDGTGGGAIRVRGGSATLNNSTVTRNEAPNGGGLTAVNDGSLIKLANTIVAGNTDNNQADGNFPDCLDLNAVGVTTHFQTQGYNILGNAQGCQLSPATGDQFGSPASPVNPLLAPNAAFNGGPFAQVFTYALQPGSPAIDRGDPSSSCSSIDARILQRTLGGRCDVGAYELVNCQTTAVNRIGTFGNDTSATPELAPTTGADGYLGFDGGDTLQGAEGNDALCGGNGGDTLTGGPGADALVGGSDNDTLNGSLGGDRLIGNTGNDTIKARDGKVDTVTCGSGTDRVTADRADKVARDCERVSRN